ncbi:DUF5686 and carboxypeptidase regulatory-like domain-containing protein [Fulvivirga aurantia]|uniref:DUF5686 and carboxypeptidase regulatory-like domain-containing protein n=1 Tax=Fulvivirga aurantia TaxID=2529383 RepID=UPI0012BBC849|nr:DUF5686 and carboxypeptidase regulatory-like domain-containing protein [Fulvivirga aurantia]
MKRTLLTLLGALSLLSAIAGGIKGKISNENGEPLPFATIYVKQIETGTTTNADAFYEISLKPGKYTITYQYVGYESVSKEVEIGESYTTINVVLKTQTMVLQGVQVYAGKEDPAYTIMRKAIAKSKFHTQQIDGYKAKVYIKGKGELKDAPFFLRKTLEKEGIKEGRVFITESVSEVEYKRPNIYTENVISIFSSGDDNNTSPNSYINGSFYEPEVGNSISPLSPKAFSYYRFEYDGTFRDRGYEVSKIKVTPRSRGDNVFQGYIQIVEDYWSIHSLDLETTKLGIKFSIKQIYEPLKEKVWLPVTHDFDVSGKVLGFEFEGEYLATVSNYEVTINPDLDLDIEVVDEKVEKELAAELEEKFDKEEASDIQKLLTSGEEVTRKQLNKVIKAYEKAELEETENPEIISQRTMKVDTLAYERDSAYWAAIRPVPLTDLEQRGYLISDSIANVRKMESEGDTLNRKRNSGKFALKDLLFGNRYKLKDKTYFTIYFPKPFFNTVEGFNIDYRLAFSKTFENKSWVSFGPTARYAFAREKLSGFFNLQYDFGELNKRSSINLDFGRYVSQINRDEPIHPIINTFMNLFLERNYMKIYEKDFIELRHRQKFSDKLTTRVNVAFEQRRQLFNNTRYRFFDLEGQRLTPNQPVNLQLTDTSFPEHEALTASVQLEFKPWQKYRIYNKHKYAITGSSPVFEFKYTAGLPDVAGSDIDYNLVELGVQYDFKIGVRGLVDFYIQGGKFLTNNEMQFIDYKHFMGNRTPFTTANPVGSFRLLDYYSYSTKEEYFQASVHYQFRKFLLTRIPIVRLAGVRESFFTNYLANDITTSYVELGYGINYIFRIFRVEGVTSFVDGEFKDFGVRLGIAANFDDIF